MTRWSGGMRGVALVAGTVGFSLVGLALVSFPSSSDRAVVAAGRQQAGDPVAAFADPGDVSIDAPATFDGGQSQGSGLTYTWDFGDGSTAASGASVQHTYTAVDDFRVQLSVRDGQGRTNSTGRVVRVIPTVDTLTGEPELKQIVPALSFPATLSLNASGPARISLKIGGTFLYSDTFDYGGGQGSALFTIPDVRVVNEDDPDMRDQLIDKPGASIPLQNNVRVTLSYPVSTGGSESTSYVMSLNKPAGSPSQPAPAPGPSASPTPSATPEVATGAGHYLQTRPTPTDRTSPTPTSRPQAASPSPQPTTASSVTAMPDSAPPAAAPAPSTVWDVTYPSYLTVVGYPTNADDVDRYYVKGDPEFHAVDDPLLRRYAIKIARNGGVFPNDPQRAADNIYRYVYGLLGIGDPGELQTDVTILARILSGALVPGSRSGEYICIAHAYFLSSLTRTLGLPTRELTIGLGSAYDQDSTGAWKVSYYQEGANQVWYGGDWHHYDTWIGTRDPVDYLVNHLNAVEWYAFSVERTPFTDINDNPVGLAGHDFSIGKYAGSPGSPEEWRYLQEVKQPGVRIAPPGPEAYQSTERATATPRETVVAGILNPASDASGSDSR